MAQAINSTLKGYFNAGDEPTETQFATLIDSNLNLAYTTLAQEITGSVHFGAGSKNMNITEQSGTGTEDLTATTTDLVWYSNAAQAADITLPDATANNVGMTIKVIVGTTDWATSAFKLGFDNSGTCVLTGYMHLMAADGAEASDGFVITADAQSLQIDANDPATAIGGSIGSTYLFTYLEEDLVHCEANGVVTTGTPALAAGAATTTGTS